LNIHSYWLTVEGREESRQQPEEGGKNVEARPGEGLDFPDHLTGIDLRVRFWNTILPSSSSSEMMAE
jgi:hypothetical protein